MSSAASALIRSFYRSIEIGDETLLHEVLAAGWEEIPPAYPGQALGAEGYLPIFRGFRQAFPDGRFEIHEIIEAAPKYTVRTTVHGTHQGVFLEQAPTGKPIRFQTIDIHEIEDGKIRRSWHIEDFFSALMQIKA